MNISKFLGRVIGLYLIIVSIAMLTNMNQFASFVNGLINNRDLMFLSGFITCILGILLVVSHNIWRWNWRVIITVIAWLTLIKGISLIFYPQIIDKTSILFVKNISFAYFIAVIDLILGIIIGYFGCKA